MLLYKIIHLQSGFKYVGQTTRPPIKRWREHLYPLRKGRHYNRYLQAAWDKYGESSFRFEIVKEYNTLEELNQAEIELIRSGTDLYNLADGGNDFQHQENSKKAIGESNKMSIVGMCVKTGEIREYDSAASAEKEGFDQKCIRKCVVGFVSERKDGSKFESFSHKGWVWMSKESCTLDLLKAKCDIAKIAKIRKERLVIGMNIFTKEIRQFKSASEAGRNGFTGQTVYRACNTVSSVHKGFVWVFGDITSPQSLLEDKAKKALSSSKRGPKSWQ
jgi:group I intron endonuclease